MEIKEKKFKGVYEINLSPYFDTRGYFMRTYDSNLFKEYGITTYGMKRNRVLELKEYILEKCRDALEAKLEIQRLQRLNRLPSSQFVKHRKNKKKKVLV